MGTRFLQFAKIYSLGAVLLTVTLIFSASTSAWADEAIEIIPIYRIQGDAAASPMVDWWVDTYGVVTGVTATGFYLQDPIGDHNPASSDGLFVYTRDTPAVSPGQCIFVQRALVSEYYEKTELSRAKSVLPSDICPTLVIPSVPVPLPAFGSAPETLYEPYEGMLVTLTGLTGLVQGPTKHFKDGGSEIALLPEAIAPYLAGGRVFQAQSDATMALVHLSNGLGAALPDVGWGSRLVVGQQQGGQLQARAVLDYNFGKFQFLLLPDQPITIEGQPVAAETGQEETLDDFSVCSFNLYALGRGSAQYVNEVEYRAQLRQRAKAIHERLLGCSVIALQELGSPEDGNRLVAELHEQFGRSYQLTALPSPQMENPEFPLTNGLLTRPDRVQVLTVHAPQACSEQDYEVPTGDSPCPPGQFPLFDRLPLVVDLQISGTWGEPYPLQVIVNHWKSKAGDEAVNAVRRNAQATFVADLAQQAIAANKQMIVLGDLNDYYGSEPVERLRTGVTPALRHTFNYLPELDRYSYIFNGASQVLDHALISPKLADILISVDLIHFNVNYPYLTQANLQDTRHSSDHEPIQLRFRPAGGAMLGGNLRYPGLSITLRDASGQAWSTTTDALGDFRFWNLQPGPISLHYTTPNFVALAHTDMALSLQPGYNQVATPAVQHQTVALGIAAALSSADLAGVHTMPP